MSENGETVPKTVVSSVKVKPDINFSKTIPSQFEWMNKPARCNATLNISCINNENKNSIIYGLNTPVSLLPDTEYTCTGEYPYEKQHIKSNELSFKIKCGESCTKLNGATTVCSITGLLPYKKYECNITGTVNKKHYVIFTGNSATLSDKPIFKSKIKEHNPTHNSLEINCENIETDLVWNGGKGTFTAEITYNGETITAGPKDKCLFTFSDLYYLATYDVKITAENTEGFSAFITSEATTKCKNNLC
ncbi:hypothetical protein cypCar_00046927 [Cyprinus carpio]|nr:hypothetical protein cypCar_00046927 [Cyprinus carpio]